MSDQTRHNSTNESAEHEMSSPSMEHVRTPADERGNGLATPPPTCQHPEPVLYDTRQSLRAKESSFFPCPPAPAPSGQGTGTFRSGFSTFPASLSSQSFPLLPSGTSTCFLP